MADDELQQASEQQAIPESKVEAKDDGVPSLGLAEEASERSTPVISDGQQGDREYLLPFPVVGVGGSAGGVEAYIQLFQHLPADTGMAFVVISHLQADQKSHLPEIVARHTAMPTVTITDGARPEPNHIYFLPPNARVCLQAGAFQLEKGLGAGPPHPIDVFFRSLASAQKTRAIGIVLSGMDSDGTLGLKGIRGEGGIAIVQSPESARFPDMPRSSISADHVDIVVPPDQMGQHLAQLARQYQNPELHQLEQGEAPADEAQHFGRILKLLKSVSGVDFRLYKQNTLQRRIARRMLMQRIRSLADYAAILQGNPKELQDLQEDILISVTRFFRDPEVFETLQHSVFPQIFANRPADHPMRAWVAGCSSGEEVYSIAICLLEYLTGNTSEPSIQIFGTDASERSIQKARLAIYPETITSEVSPERLRRYFVKTEKGYQVAKRIRDLCIFARQNLCHDPPFSRLELVSCRNVLIYFGSQLQRQLIPTFHYALRPEGVLLLGTSETIREFSDLFSLADRKHKIYSKVGHTPPRALMEVAPRLFPPDFIHDVESPAPREGWSDLELQRKADRVVLARYGPPGVVVNEQMEILQSRGHTGLFLEMAQGAASLQLRRMARDSIAPQVTGAVKQAIEQDRLVRVEGLQVRDGEQSREVTLEVLPIHTTDTRSRCYLVLFVPQQTAQNADAVIAPAFWAPMKEDEKERLIVEMQQELSSTKLYLESLLEERDARNQELISANEEIQSANEELQSTNEELETTKEELQSSNEELQTVNDELQNRNTVLTQASNDLTNLLNSVAIPVLMLSSDFKIRHFTPQTQRLMNVLPADIGRPFQDIRLNLNVDNLEPIFTEVLDTLGSREIEVQDREGHWHLLRIRPYRTADNKIDGLVVVLVDIDQLRRSQQELRDARDFATSIIESISLPVVVVDSLFRIRSTNEAFCAMAGSTSEALERRSLPDLAVVLLGAEQPLRSLLESLRGDRGAARSFEFEHKTSDGTPKIFSIRGRVLQPDGEEFLLVTFQDITAHREVERLLKVESERLSNEVKSTTKELDRSREELRALTDSLLTSQEEERRRLARELHDDVSQRLAAISIDGDQILANITEDPALAREKLEAALAQMSRLSEDVRTLSHRLHPSMIEDLGLAPALRSLTREFGEREEMIATFSAKGVPETLPVEIATGLYRIAQEALRNVAKHAGKTHVKVQILGVAENVELQIMDSGTGFDMERNPSGLGLISMKERARLIGAKLEVHSSIGEGTKIKVCAPLPASGQGL